MQNYFLYGADYNPEQWIEDEKVLKEDIALMKEAHINCVSLGIFAWSTIEKEEGIYDFSFLKNVVNNLYQEGISTILATPSGARPSWLAKKYPSILRTNERGEKESFGGRHNHCFTSAEYRRLVHDYDKALALAFKGNKAILLYHISNELQAECFCPLCQEAFRTFLKNKYKSIENLNKAWYSAFWSKDYFSFEDILPPSPLGENSNNGLALDWMRFVSYQNLDFYLDEVKAIKEVDNNAKFTTNFMYFFPLINYFDFKDYIDVASWDNYPLWHKYKQEESETALSTSFFHDLIYSVKNKPFLMMESTPDQTNWQDICKLKKPGMLELSSLNAVAHGSCSVQYFQWRKSLGGPEQFHGAVVNHQSDNKARTFLEVKQLGQKLETLSYLAPLKKESKCAIIYDWENRWALDISKGPRNADKGYHQEVVSHYKALRENGVEVTVLDSTASFEGFKVIVAPMLFMFRKKIEVKLEEFVKNGGILVMTYHSGIVDENMNAFREYNPKGLTDVLGIRREEIDPLYDDETKHIISLREDLPGTSASLYSEVITPSTATALSLYDEDYYKGRIAVSQNTYFKGSSYYFATHVTSSYYKAFYKNILPEELMLDMKLEEGVFVSKRGNNLIYQNFNDKDVRCSSFGLKPWETLIL